MFPSCLVRPVFIQDDYQRFDISADDPFQLDGGGYTVTDGGDVSLSCRALGNPEPQYYWERNGKPLSKSIKSMGFKMGEVHQSVAYIYRRTH